VCARLSVVGLLQRARCVRQAAEEYLHGVVDAATRGCEAQPVPDIATCLQKGAPGPHSAPHAGLPHVELPAPLGPGTSWSARVTRPCLNCLLEGALLVPPGRGSNINRLFLSTPPALWLAWCTCALLPGPPPGQSYHAGCTPELHPWKAFTPHQACKPGAKPTTARAACMQPMRRAAAGEAPGATPWFDAYQREFMRMLAFGELETFDHPVACASHFPPKLHDLQCDQPGTRFGGIVRCQYATCGFTPTRQAGHAWRCGAETLASACLGSAASSILPLPKHLLAPA